MEVNESLQQGDFQFLQKLIYDETGIVIADHKREMISRRLSKRMRELEISNMGDYCGILRENNNASEMNNFVNAVTTNLTSFFRENHHFEYLKNEFYRSFIDSGKKRLRIWSSASSTGEEPYSIAMSLKEAFSYKLDQIDVKILATDLDTQVIQTGKNAVYDQGRLKDLDDGIKLKWFDRDDHNQYTVKQSLRDLIIFNKLNLLGPWPIAGQFDVIFCRNVLIYFDKPTQEKIVDRFYNVLQPNGILMLGHSESVLKGNDKYISRGKTIYQKKGD